MTRQIVIPTKQHADSILRYILDTFKYIDNHTESIVLKHPDWKHDPDIHGDWCSKPKILYTDIETNIDDIQSWRNTNKHYEQTDAMVCFPKQMEFKNCRDEVETGTYYNAYSLFRLEENMDKIKEYAPKELPPLYDLAKFNNIRVIYGPGKEWGGFMRVERSDDDKSIMRTMQLAHDISDLFFHELAHCYDYNLWRNELRNYDGSGVFIHDQNNGSDVRELTVELTACTLSMVYGRDTIEKSISYIERKLHCKNRRHLLNNCNKVLQRTMNVLHSILDDAEKLADSRNTRD